MIESARDLNEGSLLETDICIVGAGAAGISLAMQLNDRAQRVLILEAGSEKETPEATDFYRGSVANADLHSPTDQYRHRVFGGSTRTWGGRCIPFDPIDFVKRDWVPASGWPICYDDVAPYYKRATQLADAGDDVFSATGAVPGGMREIVRGFDPEHFGTDGLERFSHPTDFGRRYRGVLSASRTVRILLDASCTEIVPAADGSTIDHLVARNPSGARLTVRAGSYVLATGGIEVARLLLASQAQSPAGVGNGHDLVGRYYMCHIAGTTATVRFSCDPADVFHDYERSPDGVYCRRRFRLKEEAQRRHRVNNVVLRLHHPRLPDPAHGRGILSAIYLAKPFISYEYSKRLHGSEKLGIGVMAKHVLNVVREPFATAGFLVNWFRRRTIATRKFPSLIVRPRNNVYSIDVHGEQTPNPDSRITLAGELDRFGMPRVRVDWQWLPLDIETVKTAVALLDADLRAAGKGEIEFDPQEVADDMLRDGAYGGHHIGTARMAADPRCGVVDADCKVHGVDNLYIASSAVFPTSGQANPTLTIIALSLRLADHLTARADEAGRSAA